MPLKIRHIRSPRKAGDKLTFATIPTREASRINSRTLRKNFEQYYGAKADYNFLAEQVHDFSAQDSRERVIPILATGTKEIEEQDRYQLKSTSHYLALKKVGKKGKTIALVPAPAVHDIMKGVGFDNVLNILQNGFEGGWEKEDNAIIKQGRAHKFNMWGHLSPISKDKITRGDNYSFELFPEEGQGSYAWRDVGRDRYDYNWQRGGKIGEGEDKIQFNYGIVYASPRRIMSLNIRLNPESSDKDKLAKMEFYKKQIADKYNIPVRFYETSGKIIRVKEREHMDSETYETGRRITPKTLERKLGVITAIISLLGGLFFLSSNVTGNVIGSQSSSNIIGAILLIIGLISGFFWFKKRK